MHMLDISRIRSSHPDIRLRSRIASFKPGFGLRRRLLFLEEGHRLTLLFLQTQTWAESDNVHPRHSKYTTFIRASDQEFMTSYLCPHISSCARKYTTNARGSRSNDDSIRWICYNCCMKRSRVQNISINTIPTSYSVAYFKPIHF